MEKTDELFSTSTSDVNPPVQEEVFEAVEEILECTYHKFFKKFFDPISESTSVLNFDIKEAKTIISDARIQTGIETICITFFEQIIQKLMKIDSVVIDHKECMFYLLSSDYEEISNSLSPLCNNFLRCVSEKTSGFSFSFENDVNEKLKNVQPQIKLLHQIIVTFLNEFKNYFDVKGRVYSVEKIEKSRHFRLLTSSLLMCKYILL